MHCMLQERQYTELANRKWVRSTASQAVSAKHKGQYEQSTKGSMVVPVHTQHRLQMAVAGPGASAKQRFHEAPCRPVHILPRHRLGW